MNHTPSRSCAALAVVALAGCATGGSGPIARAELNDKPVNPTMVQLGEDVWREKGCYACHGFGRVLAAPDLAGVMDRRDHDWLHQWLKDTDTMLDTDPQAQAMLEEWHNIRMPNMKLSDHQIQALFHYMAQRTAEVRAGDS